MAWENLRHDTRTRGHADIENAAGLKGPAFFMRLRMRLRDACFGVGFKREVIWMAKRKYTPAALRKAVSAYFASISRTKTVAEAVDSGRRDDKGHVIYDYIPVRNDAGEEIKTTEYVIPPTEGDLCLYLGIHRATWARWADRETYPELAEIVEDVRDRLYAWNARQLLERDGKDVRGIIFNLQNNYGYADRTEVELGEKTRELRAQELTMEEKLEYIRAVMGDGDGGED